MKMASSLGRLYADILHNDFGAFLQRSFLELNPQGQFEPNWHIEVLAAKLEQVRRGKCKRLIVNLPPRHLKSHTASIAFPAWLLGHDPAKQILAISYGQELSDKFARGCRTLMMSPFTARCSAQGCRQSATPSPSSKPLKGATGSPRRSGARSPGSVLM